MFSETLAWRAVLALDRVLAERAPQPGERFLVTPGHAEPLITGSQVQGPPVGAAGPQLVVHTDPGPAARPWQTSDPVDEDAARVLDLYLPIVLAPARGRPLVIAHLAQSLDGRIATAGGISQWISAAQDQVHNHRMRALCDAVLVGAETVIHDDPQLTCREVEGSHPVRVVVDPRRRVSLDRRIFHDDAAPTVIVTSAGNAGDAPLPAHVSRLELGAAGQPVAPRAILEALWARRVRRVFVEGGGVTVSSFLHAGLLDRLQLAIAPVIIGSGRASISLPDIETLEHAMRPRVRRFDLGPDVLFECVFEGRAP